MEDLFTSIDLAITGNKRITVLGDCNIDYLNNNERECLDSIMVTCGLEKLNSAIPTRISGISQRLIDCISTDHSETDYFVTFISNSLFKATKNKELDRRATSIVTGIEVKEPPKVFLKQIIVKTSDVF